MSTVKAVTRNAWLAYGLALLVIVVDQISKAWVLARLHYPGDSMPFLPFLSLTLVHNPGVSFNVFHDGAAITRWGLVVFSTLVAVGLIWWARRAEKALTGAALGFIIGGALGNVIDRIRVGVVTDFLDASALHFPWVFNAADSAITVGVALLLLDGVLAPKKP